MNKLYESFEIVRDPDMGLVAKFTFTSSAREYVEITGSDPDDGMTMPLAYLRDNVATSAETLTNAGIDPAKNPDHALKVEALIEMTSLRSSLD